jgi:hypothetical protein
MKLQRADEMEQFQNNKSAKNSYIFFTLALLVWSLINLFSKGKTGWEFTIFLVGNVVFFWSRIFYRIKMK